MLSIMHNVLWTGGWDSTYRVLDLVAVKGRHVQPYFMTSRHRRSVRREAAAMEGIRARIGEHGKRIAPTIVVDGDTLPKSKSLAARLETLRASGYLGTQYLTLARLAEHLGLADCELSVHFDDRAYEFIAPHAHEVRDGADSYHQLNVGAPYAVRMFERFRFPLLTLTKLDMEARAREHGFADIMELTWFCHSPFLGRPCGTCAPCRYTIDEGLGRRVPLLGHARYWAWRLLKRAR